LTFATVELGGRKVEQRVIVVLGDAMHAVAPERALPDSGYMAGGLE
jgi:hypothetical protein